MSNRPSFQSSVFFCAHQFHASMLKIHPPTHVLIIGISDLPRRKPLLHRPSEHELRCYYRPKHQLYPCHQSTHLTAGAHSDVPTSMHKSRHNSMPHRTVFLTEVVFGSR